jgi:hypothetical protein
MAIATSPVRLAAENNVNPTRKMRALHSVAITVALLTSCQYNPFAHRFVTEEPDWADVEGAYKLSLQTLVRSDPSSFDKRHPCIELLPERRYSAVNFPSWERSDSGWRLVRQLSLSENWQGTITGGVSNGNRYSKTWGIKLSPHPAGDPPDRLIDFFDHPGKPTLGRNKGRLELISTYGDGDAGDVLIFAREESGCAG